MTFEIQRRRSFDCTNFRHIVVVHRDIATTIEAMARRTLGTELVVHSSSGTIALGDGWLNSIERRLRQREQPSYVVRAQEWQLANPERRSETIETLANKLLNHYRQFITSPALTHEYLTIWVRERVAENRWNHSGPLHDVVDESLRRYAIEFIEHARTIRQRQPR